MDTPALTVTLSSRRFWHSGTVGSRLEYERTQASVLYFIARLHNQTHLHVALHATKIWTYCFCFLCLAALGGKNWNASTLNMKNMSEREVEKYNIAFPWSKPLALIFLTAFLLAGAYNNFLM